MKKKFINLEKKNCKKVQRLFRKNMKDKHYIALLTAAEKGEPNGSGFEVSGDGKYRYECRPGVTFKRINRKYTMREAADLYCEKAVTEMFPHIDQALPIEIVKAAIEMFAIIS